MTNDDLHDLDFTPALARCARCGRPAPISEEDVAGDGGSPEEPDLHLDVVTPTPRGWHGELDQAGDPTDDDVCSACSTEAEREATADDLHEGAVVAAKVLNDASPGEGRPWEPCDFLDEPPDPDDDDPVAA